LAAARAQLPGCTGGRLLYRHDHLGIVVMRRGKRFPVNFH
jgi:hypothetical protein